jgi:hypothetical protein
MRKSENKNKLTIAHRQEQFQKNETVGSSGLFRVSSWPKKRCQERNRSRGESPGFSRGFRTDDGVLRAKNAPSRCETPCFQAVRPVNGYVRNRFR